MELFKEIRLKIGRAIMLKKVAGTKRKVKYSNFSTIRSIGIVWDASKAAEFASLSRFHQKMLERKIDVMVLGYFPGRTLPDRYTAIRFLRCIRQDEINTFYQPVSAESKSFIKNPYDVLIDINFDNHFPLEYITALSMARFKVGLYNHRPADSMFDMMMELKAPVDIDGYLSQVVHYLEMIKENNINTVEK
jgi:hypothetical protein